MRNWANNNKAFTTGTTGAEAGTKLNRNVDGGITAEKAPGKFDMLEQSMNDEVRSNQKDDPVIGEDKALRKSNEDRKTLVGENNTETTVDEPQCFSKGRCEDKVDVDQESCCRSEEFIIDRITDDGRNAVDDSRLYRVHWFGYRADCDTSELIESLPRILQRTLRPVVR